MVIQGTGLKLEMLFETIYPTFPKDGETAAWEGSATCLQSHEVCSVVKWRSFIFLLLPGLRWLRALSG